MPAPPRCDCGAYMKYDEHEHIWACPECSPDPEELRNTPEGDDDD